MRSIYNSKLIDSLFWVVIRPDKRILRVCFGQKRTPNN